MDAGTSENWEDDPGWHLGWHLLLLLVPYAWTQYLRRSRGDLLANLRSVYLSFPSSMILFGVVIPFVLPFHGDQQTLPWAMALVAIGVVTTLLMRVLERPLPCDSLAGGFRTRMFLRIAFAETTALFGFVFAFIVLSGWLYYFAVLLSVPGLIRAAPTRGALIREQQELTARGCGRSLVAALRTTRPEPK
jgi:F0F1-type ATP synthase membrane subunit c/vacuolar-type H+-ATPase subunit K